MYLKKLEISGFKSFALKTTLNFLVDSGDEKNQGITAIVGPNGSGKSNVADAVRWVMGEQSMKNLRGKKSEDIIFAGSGKKARMGNATVTLYLDNSDNKIPLDFQEVSIARKIFRSGESEYLINNSRVRLQDVIDILAKAGVGKESYAIVNQGMADSVLNASQLERRMMIEDAAGVKQHQIKKERSLRKLETTKQNLIRVGGLISEIEPHLKMLKRQSQKASESEVVSRELIQKQTTYFSYLWHNFQKEMSMLNGAKDEMGRVMNNMQRELDKLTDEMGNQSKKREDETVKFELEKKQREQRSRLNQLEKELMISEGRIEIEKEKQKNIEILEEIKIKSIPVDLRYIRENIESIKRDQEKLIERIEKVEKLEELQEIKEFARVIGQKLFELKSDIEKGKKEERIKQVPKPVPVTVSLVDSEVVIKLKERILKIKEEIEEIELEIKKTENEIREELDRNREERQGFFEVEKKFRVKQEELNRLKDQYNESKIALAKVEVREEDLRNQVKEEIRKNVEDLVVVEEEINRQKMEEEIHKLKIKMEQIGGIDPMVIDEYQETSKRFEFLTKESQDLERAIVSLWDIVKEMEQKIEKEFESTYEEINKEFTKYFRIIFGGGNAHLIKSRIKNKKSKEEKEELNGEVSQKDNEEIVETEKEEERSEIGIDISACPPGKKISSLAILSGGERSLTSLALLFAIISHNPPPFAILDEVEAALDEANSKRFGRILQELSGNTQFVTITHNRETMRQASLLYGVTMGEDGISKLLSVRLDQIGQGGKIIQ